MRPERGPANGGVRGISASAPGSRVDGRDLTAQRRRRRSKIRSYSSSASRWRRAPRAGPRQRRGARDQRIGARIAGRRQGPHRSAQATKVKDPFVLIQRIAVAPCAPSGAPPTAGCEGSAHRRQDRGSTAGTSPLSASNEGQRSVRAHPAHRGGVVRPERGPANGGMRGISASVPGSRVDGRDLAAQRRRRRSKIRSCSSSA